MPKFFKEQINLSKKNRVRIYVDTSLQIDGNITCDEKNRIKTIDKTPYL